MNDVKILLADHRADSFGPPVALAEYLKKNCDDFSYVSLPLGFSKTPQFSIRHFISGTLKFNKTINYDIFDGYNWHGDAISDIFREIMNLCRLTRFVFSTSKNKKFDIGIGIDPTTTFILLILQKIGLIRYVAYGNYNDPMTQRSKKSVINSIYKKITKFCLQHSNCVWYRWSNHKNVVHRLYGKFDEKQTFIVPIGLYRKFTREVNRPPKKLICSRHIAEYAGIHLIIQALPDVVKIKPNIEFVVIGDGQYLDTLKTMTKKLNLEHTVKFLGFMPHEKVLKKLSECDIGIATYLPTHLRKTFEPNAEMEALGGTTSTMELLGAGMPIIATRGMGISEAVEKRNAGIAIDYDVTQATNALLNILDEEKFPEMANNAVELSQEYEYDSIYSKTLNSIIDDMNSPKSD
ncbi:putative colanic acid biosynthesis glycosyltransferase WcaL protein [Marine Group I thaumarchaeote SCGC AAA799-B03]|uniref:Putative colanic acid biosynthesis glycosyltransferase WcaL protein n=1 Tax=Marine Group I thaumarchaeote SCGC AAA799-B03 TaxID=1502289 RepID=A0A087S912_9ARCH|nr:putative colanic acid biosynthesis glycosyltransferase WcaL protein [Marine Group I thaumarchaeote SCGC AAA799-B03]